MYYIKNIKRSFLFIMAFLLAASAVTRAQIVESRRLAANSLWDTYGRNANNPSQMPNAIPVDPGNNVDQIVVSPNYNELKNALTSLVNNNGGILHFNNTGPATVNFSEVIELVPPYSTRDKVRTVVIQGANITFDGMNTSSIFLIRGRVQFVVQDAVFRNANFQGQSMANLNTIFRTGGGAIEMSQSGPLTSVLRVRNCQFLNNTVSHFQGMGENQNGAAIRLNYGSSAEIFGCTFINNRAVTGGAIGATSIEKMIIIDSDFDSNLSNGYSSTVGYMDVFEGAGAVRVDRTVKPLEIYGCKFTRNSGNVKTSVMQVFAAPVSGFNPGMPLNEPALVVDNCEFSNNKYNNYAGVTNFSRAFFAGCVVFQGNSAEMRLTNSVFNNNDVGQANIRMINNFEFSNCIFANTNYLTTSESIQQGAIFLQNVPQYGSFNNCTFYNNEPRSGGIASDIMFWAANIPSRVELNNSIFYRTTNSNTKQVKEPLMGIGNNQFIPNANMSTVAEVSTSPSNKTNPNISPNSIVDMCLGVNSLPANIGGLPDCSSPGGGNNGGGTTTNTLDCTSLTSSVVDGSSVTLSVGYEVSASHDVVFAVWQGNTWRAGGRTTVAAGVDTASITVNFDNTANDILPGTYEIRALLWNVGENWNSPSGAMPIDSCMGNTLTVAASSGGGNNGGGNNGGGASDLDTVIAGPSFDVESHPTDNNQIRVVGNAVGYVRPNNWIRYNAFNFGVGATSVDVMASSGSSTAGGNIEFRLGSPTGTLVGTVTVTGTANWSTYETFSANLTGASGIHDLYVVFTNSNSSAFYLLNMQNVTFNSSSAGASDLDTAISAPMFDAESHPADNNQIRIQGSVVGYVRPNNWIRYDAFNFGSGATSVSVRASTPSLTNGGNIEFRLGSPTGTLLGTVNVTGTAGWGTYQSFSTNLTGASGVGDLYLVFKNSNNSAFYLLNVQDFTANSAP